MSEIRLVPMTEEQASELAALGQFQDGEWALPLADAYVNGITEKEVQPVLEITRYRVASPDAARYHDWSVVLDGKLRGAFKP